MTNIGDVTDNFLLSRSITGESLNMIPLLELELLDLCHIPFWSVKYIEQKLKNRYHFQFYHCFF